MSERRREGEGIKTKREEGKDGRKEEQPKDEDSKYKSERMIEGGRGAERKSELEQEGWKEKKKKILFLKMQATHWHTYTPCGCSPHPDWLLLQSRSPHLETRREVQGHKGKIHFLSPRRHLQPEKEDILIFINKYTVLCKTTEYHHQPLLTTEGLNKTGITTRYPWSLRMTWLWSL